MKKYPVVILHGWNLSALKYKELQQELIKRGYKVYCFDLPGFGSSKQPDNPLFLSDYTDYIKNFIINNKIKKIILIGHSFGGRIGIKLAVTNPNLIHALILTGTPGVNLVPQVEILFFRFLAKIGNAIFSFPFLCSIKDTARKILYRVAKASDFYNTPNSMKETFKNVVKEDLKPYLTKINAPALLLWGKDDMIVPVSVAEKMSKLIQNSKLVVIPDARHGLPWTHSRLFAEEINKFLDRL